MENKFNNRKIYTHLNFGLEFLDLPDKLIKRFLENGKIYVSDVCELNYDDILNIKGIGKSTAKKFINNLNNKCYLNKLLNHEIIKIVNDFSKIDNKILCPINYILKHMIINTKNDFIEYIYNNDEILKLVKDYLLNKLECKEVLISEFKEYFPEHIKNTTYQNKIIDDLLNDNKVEITSDVVRIKYLTFIEYINKIKNERNKKILIKRLEGYTLEEIGKLNFVTRERIRQVINKYLNKTPKLYEDKYMYIYTKYMITKEIFFYVFKDTGYTYNYLNIKYKIGKEPIEKILDDKNVSIRDKREFEKYIYKDYIKLGDKRVKLSRDNILRYTIYEFARDSIKLDDLIEIYDLFLEDIELSEEEQLTKLNNKAFFNKIINLDYILYSFGQNIRYYNIKDKNFDELLKELNLEQYKDIEISTLKLFDENKELMHDYDIRNEYELHNLLKKICVDSNYNNLNFSRMPILKFGKPNREKQVIDLLYEVAPINSNDFVELYKLKYGIASKTIIANYINCISKFLYNGVYKVDSPILDDDIINKLKKCYKEDFYNLEDAKKIYIENFPELKIQYFNPYTFKEIGFNIYSDYILKNKYKNSLDFFNEYILKFDYLNLNDVPSSIKKTVSFRSCLNIQKSNYEIIEYKNNSYINIRALNKMNIYKKDIFNYRDYIKSNVKDKYFTIKSIRLNGLKHYLDDFKFDDIFYASIISEDKEDFSSQRNSDVKLLKKGKGKVYLEDLIEFIVFNENNLYIDIEKLKEILKDIYGIIKDKYKIIESIRDTKLFYSKIRKKIYADYDIFCKEVE